MVLSKTKAHKLLGHSNNDSTTETAKALGWKLTGTKQVCESCYLAKAKQKNIPKVSAHVPATQPSERLFINLLKFKKPEDVKYIGKPN